MASSRRGASSSSLTAAIAESKRAPFDLPEGESELVAGYLTEFSSMKFAIMTLADFIAVVFVAAITTVLFLGGWQVPFLYGDGFHAASPAFYPILGGVFALAGSYVLAVLFSDLFRSEKWRQHHNVELHAFKPIKYVIENFDLRNTLQLLLAVVLFAHAVLFFVMGGMQDNGVFSLPYPVVVALRLSAMLGKVLFLCWFQLMIRWTLPRFRYDQVMRLGWKVMLPLALLNMFVTAVFLLFI